MGLLDIDINKGIEAVTKVVDESFESEDERQTTLTQRLKIDTTSPFKLPHLIRPLSFIWAMINETVLTWATIVVVFKVKDADPASINTLLAALAANTTVLTAMVGFYFKSRKEEKINAKKVMAAIEINRNQAAVEIKKQEAIIVQTKRENRLDNRERRRAARTDK